MGRAGVSAGSDRDDESGLSGAAGEGKCAAGWGQSAGDITREHSRLRAADTECPAGAGTEAPRPRGRPGTA